MKNVVVWLPLAAVLGGIVGAWGPMEELAALKEMGKENRASTGPAKLARFDPLSQLINVPDSAKRPRRARKPRPTAAEKGPETAEDAPPEAMQKPPAADKEEPPRPMLSPDDLQARIDEAAEMWRTRIQLARATALEKLGIAQDSAEAFDTALSDMNSRLRDAMQAIADILVNESEATPEIGVRLMNDISAVMVEAYDQIGGCVDAASRGTVSELNLMEFIDPSVAEPLIAVQDKLDGRAFGVRGRR